MAILAVQNHGPLIVASNYWTLPAARAGRVLISINAGAFRLLIPASQEPMIADMLTAKEILVTRAPWPEAGLLDAFEVLFDDRTDDPFALHLSPASFDRVPEDADIAIPWLFTAWTAPRRGRPHKALERACWYRRAPSIPWLRPREGD